MNEIKDVPSAALKAARQFGGEAVANDLPFEFLRRS